MKFYTTPYHSNLINDNDRLSAFYEGIFEIFNEISSRSSNEISSKRSNEISNSGDFKPKIALDIGSGSGVLSYFASICFDSVIAIEIDNKIIECAKKSFKEAEIDNVIFINDDATSYKFISEDVSSYKFINDDVTSYKFDEEKFIDLIICETLDTALIDEEELIVLNNFRKYLKDNGKILPKGIINIAEPVFMEKDYIHYEDEEYHGKKPKYEILGDFVKFAEFDFCEYISPEFKTIIDFNLNKYNLNDNFENNNKIFGIKITTFTKITDNIICGPTPMLNPPMFIPIDFNINNFNKNNQNLSNKNNNLNKNNISIKLEYIMGGGVETIKANFI